MAVSASGAQLRLVEGGAAAALGIDADGTVFVPGNQVVVHMPLGRATPSDHTEQGVGHEEIAGHDYNAQQGTWNTSMVKPIFEM